MPLKLTRRKRSPYWIIRGTVRGSRFEESTETDNAELAEEIRAAREAELHREAIYGRQSTTTFAEAAVSYVETTGNKRYLNPIIAHFGVLPLAMIDQEALDKASRKLYPDVSPSTRNRQFFTPVSAVLHHAARRKWCARPIIERPKQPRGRIRWLAPEEAERLIAACSPRFRPMVIFLLYTGARAGEAVWLDWSCVDLNRAHVTFPRTKNGDARGMPLHPRVVAALANQPTRGGEVFRGPRNRPYSRPKGEDDHSAGTRIKNAFGGACRRAGITDFTPHDCRHTWATWHYAVNRDIGALQKLGGWRSVAMVMRYAHVNVGELAATIDRLPSGDQKGDTSLEAARTA